MPVVEDGRGVFCLAYFATSHDYWWRQHTLVVKHAVAPFYMNHTNLQPRRRKLSIVIYLRIAADETIVIQASNKENYEGKSEIELWELLDDAEAARSADRALFYNISYPSIKVLDNIDVYTV